MTWQTSSTSSEDTEKLGELLGDNLSGGETIDLRSDLGGGKTTFVRGLVRGAGGPDRVASPTFTLNRVYDAKKFRIFHFDFYRLNDPGILADQLAETVEDANSVTVVEWGDIVDNVLPKDRISIRLSRTPNSPDERLIEIVYPESHREIIAAMETGYKEVRP